MLEDWNKNGMEVIKQVREKRPEVYLQAVIRLVPSNQDLSYDSNRAIHEYSTEELMEIVRAGEQEKNAA